MPITRDERAALANRMLALDEVPPSTATKTWVDCQPCNGTGAMDRRRDPVCHACRGRGKIEVPL